MKVERTKNAFKNTISGLFFKITGLIMPFVIRTIMIKQLGVDYLGLSSLFTSILQVLSLAELGFSSAVAFALYKPIVEDDTTLICSLLNLLKKIYHIIGVIILVVGLILIPFLPNLILDSNYPTDVNIYVLYLIYLFNTVISYFLFAYKGLILTANQRSDVENNIFSISYLLMYVIQIIVLSIFRNYYIYIIFLPLCTIAINLVRAYAAKKMYPNFRSYGKVDLEVRKSIFKNIGALIGHRVSWVVIVAVNNIIISAYLGLESLAIYNNYYYIMNALIGIISIFHSSITASVGNSLVTDNIDKNYHDFNVLTFVNVWIVGWMSICLVCLYQHFMLLWVGEELIFPFVTMMLFVLCFYCWKFKDILSTYKDAAGMWKADLIKPYVVIVASLLFSLFGIKLLGINATLISVIIGVFVISMPWETHVFFKMYFNKSPSIYYIRLILYTVVIVLTGVGSYFLCSLIPNVGYGWFILKMGICVVLPNFIFLICSFWIPEFKCLKRKLFNLIKSKEKNL